jgi:cytochrome c
MHGTEAKEARITLKKGYHPVWIEFIQGKGGRYFSFEWKPDDESAWSGVPPEMLLHDASEHAKLAGKNLSMRLGKLIPGDKAPLTSVHPSYDLSQARPFDFLPKVGGMDFMSDGSMIICTWDPAGAVYKLTGVETGDPAKIKVTQIAAGLAEPLGLSVIRDTIYVLQKQELTRLIDTDKDGIINAYQCVNNTWPTSANFHEFAFGLAQKDGDVFATLAIAIQPGGASGLNQISSRGKVVRFDLPSGNLEYLASGLRTPNGIGIGIDGEIFVADNQGDWLPSSKILHVSKDAFYGQRSVDYTGTEGKTVKQPMLWLPQDEIGNSPSTPLLLNDGPYKGQMIHCEVTHGGVKRDFIEKINGE